MSDLVKYAVNKAFREGMMAGVTRFAWWKDGRQYVGTTGTTLKEALDRIAKEFPDERDYAQE